MTFKEQEMTFKERLEQIKLINSSIEDLDIKPGDVKYLYVVLSDEGYQQEIAKGIYLSKEKDSYNATWYTFSIMGEDTPIKSSLPYFIFDTKEQIEAFVKKDLE
jgi:hypothetical protein